MRHRCAPRTRRGDPPALRASQGSRRPRDAPRRRPRRRRQLCRRRGFAIRQSRRENARRRGRTPRGGGVASDGRQTNRGPRARVISARRVATRGGVLRGARGRHRRGDGAAGGVVPAKRRGAQLWRIGRAPGATPRAHRRRGGGWRPAGDGDGFLGLPRWARRDGMERRGGGFGRPPLVLGGVAAGHGRRQARRRVARGCRRPDQDRAAHGHRGRGAPAARG
mmetsp:Transcript_2960/g.11650  ORF Transcript_2960/g.11650 Transcript_2960/m.11650 type:complete len:222 (-) Transcript_2960:482-1147(-)